MRARVRRDASGPSLSRVVNRSTAKHETAERARAAPVDSEREAGTEARIEKAGLTPSAPSTSRPWPVLAAATLPRDGLPVHSPFAEGVDIDDIEGAAYFVFDAPDESQVDLAATLHAATRDPRDYLVTWTDGPEVRELFKAAGLTVFTIDGADARIFGASYPVEDHAWLHKDADEKRKRELHAKWSKLINMSAAEIKRFLDSEDGKDAGMSAGAARAAGIGRGRDSARAIIRMLGNGRGVEQALENWSAGDWRWAGRQVSFISRMRGNDGPLYDDKKRMTRKLKSLLVWGHDPRKKSASDLSLGPSDPGYLQPEQGARMRRIRSFAYDVDQLIESAKIYKADGDERYVLGVVLEPDAVDSQSDTISAEDIRNAAHKFMQEYGNIGLQHQTFVNGKIKILESYVAPVAFEIGDQTVKAGTWLLALRVIDDSIWDAIKDGRLTGLSIGGTGVRKPATA